MSQPKPVGRPPKSRNMNTSSDSADHRWTVRGIPINIRATAIKMSESRGMTVGDWVSEAIHFYSKADKSGIPADTLESSACLPSVETALDVEQIIDARLSKFQESMTATLLDIVRQTRPPARSSWLWPWRKAA